MARNTQLRSQVRYSGGRQYAQDSAHSQDSRNIENKAKSSFVDSNGNLKLSMKQIVIFWSGSVIIMLIAFYLGFVAGKKEGAISVLDQAGEQMVRLELHTPLEPYPRAQEVGPDISAPIVSQPPVQPAPATITEKNAEPKGTKIDFTKTTSLPTKVEEKPKNEIEKILLGTSKQNTEQKDGEEVYPGKNLFGPPKQKVKDVQNEESIEPEELAQLEKKEEVATVQQLLPTKGWYVQVAAAPSEADALSYHKKLSSKGLQLKLEPAAIKDRSFFRVLIGPYPNQAAAVEKRAELKQQTGVSGEPFIRQVQ